MKFARAAVIVAALSGGTALAVVAADHSQVLAAPQLSDSDLQAKLQSQGYTGLQDIRRDGNRVHVTASKDGQAVQLTVNSRTGQVVGNNSTDDDEDDDD